MTFKSYPGPTWKPPSCDQELSFKYVVDKERRFQNANYEKMRRNLKNSRHVFFQNGPNQLTRDQTSQKYYGLRDTTGSLNILFIYFLLRPVFNIGKLVQTNPKYGIQLLILLKAFLYKYVMNIMYWGLDQLVLKFSILFRFNFVTISYWLIDVGGFMMQSCSFSS